MFYILAFLAGIAATLIGVAVYRFAEALARRARIARTLSEPRVTTVSQVLHLAIQGAPVGVAILGANREVVMSNASAHTMGLIHERTVAEEIWKLAVAVLSDKEERGLDLRAPRRTGKNRVTDIHVVVAPLTLTDDRFVIVYATDQSEAVRMENARRDFVANVSHELKTPVGGIALLAEALLESIDDPESVDYFGERLYGEARRLGDMITELISLSKLQGAEALPDLTPVLIDDVVDEAINRTTVQAENASIRLNRGVRTGVYVLGDFNLLVTAVTNLISNAINYSPAETPVTVTQKVVSADTVHIRVTDRGIGISAEDQQRVFERFFRVDKARSRSTGGTGLGLAIVKHVAANHGGTVKLWSRPSTGSTFTIELPIYKPGEEKEDLPHPARKQDVNRTIDSRGPRGSEEKVRKQ
ncbi:sensor histidine kinase [Corynebacterium pyruviciproducens]|uniref:sensor histidine kinase n=1 Tax=Corynebacterium pyruviciproducens TaxID=598660 RepID=UPI0023F4E24C|nr:ATP-binding protein [Corynebacterium pyruviciproducens]